MNGQKHLLIEYLYYTLFFITCQEKNNFKNGIIALERVSEIWYNTGTGNAFEKVYSYTYSSAGALYSVTDHKNNEATFYKYDTEGKLVQSYTVDADYELVLSGINLRYDSQSRLSMASYSLDYYSTAGAYNEILTYEYAYDEASGDLSEMTVNGLTGVNGKILPIYDDFGRTTERTIRFNVDSEYAFYNKLTYTYQASASGLQTGLVSSVTSEVKQGVTSSTVVSSSTLQYTYDENGNITKITNNDDYSIQYSYDDLGQLIAESIDTPTLNVGYIYTYDSAGNIVSKKQYTTSGTEILSYTYSDSAWGDLLVYSPDGNDVGYDEIGNPIYIGYYAADEELWEYGYQLTWNGRQLEKIQNFEYYGESVTDFTAYTYNADGIRTSKTVNGVKHEYILNGSQILAETWYQSGVAYLLVYLYDETGAPIGLKYRTSNYANGVFDSFFFEKNLQGDIVAIYNSTGEKIGTYAYTAFGEVVTTTVSGNTTLENNIVNNYNPFRYRGYYYDVETGWYYLQSRYYNPVWGRFINADDVAYLGANGDMQAFNLFAYCNNNPVMGYDPTGKWTLAFSISLNFTLFGQGIEVSAGIAVSPDDFAFQVAYAASGDAQTNIEQTGENVSLSLNLQYTEFESVSYLDGPMENYGVNTPLGGFDILMTEDSEYVGWQLGAGPGVSYDVHRITNYTYNSTVWEMFNPTKKIAEWLGIR